MSIVIIKDGDAVTTTVVVAAGTENEHASVIALVRKYQADFEEFGRVRFEIEPFETSGGIQSREIALLDEPQASLLLTYMRNTEIVRAFKKKLVREFWEMVQHRNRTRPLLPEDLPGALRLAADLAEQKAVLALENQQQAAKIEALEHLFMPGETPTQFAKRLNGVNSQQINAYLVELKWVFNAERKPNSSPKYRVYAIARDKHWLTEKPVTVGGEGTTSFIRYAPVMLEEGTKKLFDLYMAEKLPMKQTWDGQFFYEKFNPEKPL
jgi:phage regulator Rha-like protein